MEGERWWDKELVDRSGVAADTGTPPRLLMMAPLFASVSRNDTNSSEKLCPERTSLSVADREECPRRLESHFLSLVLCNTSNSSSL